MIILDIHAWISLPWHPIHPMRCPLLARFPKLVITYLRQVSEANNSRAASQLRHQLLDPRHEHTVSISILPRDARPACPRGFWPGGGAEGAFYAYAYPAPDGYSSTAMPDGAYFSADYGEFLLPYELVRTSADPDAVVSEFLHATYDAAVRLGRWPAQPQAPAVPLRQAQR